MAFVCVHPQIIDQWWLICQYLLVGYDLMQIEVGKEVVVRSLLDDPGEIRIE